ncbi:MULTISPECIES: response regulator transcription factor [unclassified Leptospira]|uniref:response regulator transcription factor n=1 Tax=unclassified Leptospira TaxID=2633828 RepID=UPI0002BD8C9D|nr:MULTISPECIES: response regulator transcription factor [unclassified Leptospira]EMK00561.1 response regulator receiver domain protein [Leptospira sp. B5-022]MCR1793707.1 response regulator transcription factor [Leptospira sp. id769339]
MKAEPLKILVAEDNLKLRKSIISGLEESGKIRSVFDCDSGEETIRYCLEEDTDVLLLDVRLAGKLNGIETIIAIRKEFPRKPVVIYSIQDSDEYFRTFRSSGILSHYAYVRKSNYLLPQMVVPLIRLAYDGKSFIDPEIESRVTEVREKDENSPLAVLEPNERSVAEMLAKGFSNEQIAQHFGFKDKRTISRINGQIYSAWGLNETNSDEKVARTRAALIVLSNRFLEWDIDEKIFYRNSSGDRIPWTPNIDYRS